MVRRADPKKMLPRITGTAFILLYYLFDFYSHKLQMLQMVGIFSVLTRRASHDRPECCSELARIIVTKRSGYIRYAPLLVFQHMYSLMYSVALHVCIVRTPVYLAETALERSLRYVVSARHLTQRYLLTEP